VCPVPPSIADGRDVGVTLGQRGVLLCEADAVPEADFEWYRDDRRYGISLQDILLHLFLCLGYNHNLDVYGKTKLNFDPTNI